MGVGAVRAAVAGILATALPDVDVWDGGYPADPQPGRGAVIVVTGGIAPSPVAAVGRVVSLDLWLVVGEQDPGVMDDALDDLAESVLSALDGAGIDWTRAERAVYRETFHAYRIETETLK